MKQDEAVERLCDVYREDQQIGLVLGAGVSKDSGVPSWKDLPFVMLEFAKKGMFEKDSWRMKSSKAPLACGRRL